MIQDEESRRFSIGDRVRHHGTKQWGVIVEVRRERHGVELVVECVVERVDDMTGLGHWEAARIDLYRRAGDGPGQI